MIFLFHKHITHAAIKLYVSNNIDVILAIYPIRIHAKCSHELEEVWHVQVGDTLVYYIIWP